MVKVSVVVERHHPKMPRYAVIPSRTIASWGLTGTTPVEVRINGRDAARRSIKYWDADRWFLEITQKDCRAFGIDTGSRIDIELSRASTELPRELSDLIESNAGARASWERKTASQQRMLSEEIRALKQPETRARRARKWLV